MYRRIPKNLKRLFSSSPQPYKHPALKLTKISQPGMRHTFFGYYDRSPWSPCNKYILYTATNVNNFTIGKEPLHIGVYNVKTKQYRVIFKTFAWNFQQGAQQQWIDDEHIIFNDIKKGRPLSKVVSIKTGTVEQQLDCHIGLISTAGKEVVSYNYARLFQKEIDYGYPILEDSAKTKMIPDYSAMELYNIESGACELQISFEQILNEHPQKKRMERKYLWLQHPKFNYIGGKLLFVLRSREDNSNEWSKNVHSDLFILDLKTGEKLITPSYLWEEWSKGAHHPNWFDDDTIIMNCYSKSHKSQRFTRFKVYSIQHQLLAPDCKGSGHPSVSSDKKIILTDDYPDNDRLQTLKLVSISGNKELVLGKFYSPSKYRGHLSCDLHPRWANDNRFISFDSAMERNRSIYIAPIGGFFGDIL